MQKCI